MKELIINNMNELNESQREAVMYCDGPSLVVAGAGSGKTRVLTYKIAYLLDQGYPPHHILALTFTNKAAREMKNRIASLTDEFIVQRLWMGTFHSIFYRILRYEAERIGYRSDFTINDAADTKNLIRSIIKEKQLDEKIYQPKMIQSRISNAKNSLITCTAYEHKKEYVESDIRAKIPLFSEIYKTYQMRCFQSGVMDFDELLLQTNILFRDDADVLAKYQDRFRYVLVDEYQDTNFAQHMIVTRLCERHRRICVVGDDAQSIYSFRGANIDNMLGFKDKYPDSRIFKLERNYRSTQNIVNAANSLIQKNKGQIFKRVFSENAQGHKVRIIPTWSDYEEAFLLSAQVMDVRIEERCDYSDFAILYRTNAQSRIIEEALRKKNIPYRVYGGQSFYQRKEVKDLIAYFRVVVNPHDEEALKRIINYPLRGIGDTTVSKLLAAATINQLSMWQILSDPVAFSVPVNSGTLSKLTDFRMMIEAFIADHASLPAERMAERIFNQSGISSTIHQNRTIEEISQQENLQEVLKAVFDFCTIRRQEGADQVTLSDFLIEVALITDQDEKQNDNPNRVTLMTVHSAKGLEFDHVFIVGLEENLFPSVMSLDNPRAIEEERRLLYVAITRAKRRCVITYAKSRFRNGQSESCRPSRFLMDIDEQYLSQPMESYGMSRVEQKDVPQFQQKRDGYSATRVSPKAQGGYYSNPDIEMLLQPRLKKLQSEDRTPGKQVESLVGFHVGDTVLHNRFGKGEILSLEGMGSNAKAMIDFNNLGIKSLILKYANLTILKK
ncbi:MAG: UvrD-helicase domain-containing protein [Tannerella sp.]|jgi:DNA helicase-2/ATP-dependent DNA helicase PcrA|nr:UvrD-helicase domain-containing protein [Tannerella sp.]